MQQGEESNSSFNHKSQKDSSLILTKKMCDPPTAFSKLSWLHQQGARYMYVLGARLASLVHVFVHLAHFWTKARHPTYTTLLYTMTLP